jgi:hypothetical protein
VRYTRLAIATLLVPVAAGFFVFGWSHFQLYHSLCSAQAIRSGSQAMLPRLTKLNLQILGAVCAGALHRLIADLVVGIAAALGVVVLLRGRSGSALEASEAAVAA